MRLTNSKGDAIMEKESKGTYIHLTFNGASESVISDLPVQTVEKIISLGIASNTAVVFKCRERGNSLYFSPNQVPSILVEEY